MSRIKTKPRLKLTLEHTKYFANYTPGIYLISMRIKGQMQVKIGQTGNLKQRIRTYGSDEVFRIWSFKTPIHLKLEGKIKFKLSEIYRRIEGTVESFDADFDDALEIVRYVISQTPVPVVPVVPDTDILVKIYEERRIEAERHLKMCEDIELKAERHFKMCVERQNEIDRRMQMALNFAMESMAKPTVFDRVMSFLGVRKHRDDIDDEPPSKRLKYSIR